MKTIILAILISMIFLAPSIGLGPVVYDGWFYKQTIVLQNDYYQPIQDLQFTVQVGYDYFDYTAHHPDLTCLFWDGELICKIEQPYQKIEPGALVTIISETNTPHEIIWAERNFDSLSLPHQLTIRETGQHNLFMPMVSK